jgi:CO dehydrogenase maturation factor
LPNLMGASTPEMLASYLGGRSKLSSGLSELEDLRLSELPTGYVARSPDGVDLIAVGKIEEYGEGCACSYSLISKMLLSKISLNEEDLIIVDTDAGVEHLGRGMEEGIDAIIVVVNPNAEGIAIAELLNREGNRIGKPLHFILNKITPEIKDIMKKKLAEKGLKPSAVVPFFHEKFSSCLEGGILRAGNAQIEVSEFVSTLF